MNGVIEDCIVSVGTVFVHLSTPFGRCFGEWIGNVPTVGDAVDFELEAQNITSISVVETVNFECSSNESGFHLIGLVVDCDDGVLTMTVGGSIVLVDSDVTFETSRWVCVIGQQLAFYSVEI